MEKVLQLKRFSYNILDFTPRHDRTSAPSATNVSPLPPPCWCIPESIRAKNHSNVKSVGNDSEKAVIYENTNVYMTGKRNLSVNLRDVGNGSCEWIR